MSDKAHQMLVDRINARLEALPISMNAASAKTGSPSLIPNIIYGRSGSPRLQSLQRIADALETSVAYLTGMTDNPDPEAPPEFSPAPVKLPSKAMPEDVPVLGTAAGAMIQTTDGHEFEGFELESRVVQYVRRPPALATVPDAYSIFVQNDSMDPMHPAGELRFVHPHRPVGPGDSVVVQTRTWEDRPGQSYIKIYRRKAGGMLILEQLNPKATISIPIEYVLAIHRVLTTSELFGL